MKKKMLFVTILSVWIISGHAQTPGNALHFDGTNDYVTAPLPALFNNLAANDFTVEVWIKPQGSAFARVLFAQHSTNNFFSLTLSTARQVYFYLNNTVGLLSGSSLPLGQWSHVACTWKASTSEAKIYINGVLQPTTSGGTSSTGTSNMMAIGGRTGGTQYFNGELDELRIWNVVRNQCELDATRNSEYTIAQPGLVAYYKFNQGVAGGANATIITLEDFTTNYNGTLLNFGLNGSASNWVVSGAGITLLNQSTTYNATHVITACDSYTWIDGITYTTSNNTATHTVVNPLGCDSLISLDLTINHSTTSTDIHTACNSFQWIDGITYTASNNTATHTLINVDGCDSVITLDLTIITVDAGVIVTDPVITANETGATYRWLDCNDNFAVIPGETSQVFTATANGMYAVEVTKDGCTDTSVCVTISTVGIRESASVLGGVSVFPNPNQGVVNIQTGGLQDVSVKVFCIDGRLIYHATGIQSSTYTFELNEAPGVYILEVSSQGQRELFRLLRE
jgi:hypothetical protein